MAIKLAHFYFLSYLRRTENLVSRPRHYFQGVLRYETFSDVFAELLGTEEAHPAHLSRSYAAVESRLPVRTFPN